MTVAGYTAFVVVGVVMQLLSRTETARVPSFGEAQQALRRWAL